MELEVFANMPPVSFTWEALKLCTEAQLESIQSQADPDCKFRIFVDFSLPDGYIYFVRYDVVKFEVREYHGGIDPEGSIST